MKLLALGTDHRHAPADVREAIAFDGSRREEALDALSAEFPAAEVAILSTCNRVEIYAAGSEEAVPSTGALIDALARFHKVPAERFERHLFDYHDDRAIAHLFRVAASLESLVLGEGQIIGQVKEAYSAAVDRKTIGSILHAVFRHALFVGKKVRSETGLDQGKLSIASVAVDVARDVFDTFVDKTVLVIGAGKMADLTLQHLADLRPGRVIVTNRTPERAEIAAKKWGGQVYAFDRLGEALAEADVVVSTTAASEPIVNAETYKRVQRKRRNRLALILDIAIPRDFDPKIGDIDNVMLYHVDDLQAQTEANRARRAKKVDPALAIIETETAECLANLRHKQQAGDILRQLGDYADAARVREMEALFNRCPDLNESQRNAIAHTLHRLQNQFLHHPRAALRSAAADPPNEHPHPLLNAVRRLFGLSES